VTRRLIRALTAAAASVGNPGELTPSERLVAARALRWALDVQHRYCGTAPVVIREAIRVLVTIERLPERG